MLSISFSENLYKVLCIFTHGNVTSSPGMFSPWEKNVTLIFRKDKAFGDALEWNFNKPSQWKMVKKNFRNLLENFIFKWYHQFLGLCGTYFRGDVTENRSEAGKEKFYITSIINWKTEFSENVGTHPMYLEMPVKNWGCCVDVVSTLYIYGYCTFYRYAAAINSQ